MIILKNSKKLDVFLIEDCMLRSLTNNVALENFLGIRLAKYFL